MCKIGTNKQNLKIDCTHKFKLKSLGSKKASQDLGWHSYLSAAGMGILERN
jgi:hypothetical protein